MLVALKVYSSPSVLVCVLWFLTGYGGNAGSSVRFLAVPLSLISMGGNKYDGVYGTYAQNDVQSAAVATVGEAVVLV